MPYNFHAKDFHTKKLSSRLSSRKVHFYGKRQFGVFEFPLRRLGATYTVHLRLIVKPVCDFLLVNNTNYWAPFLSYGWLLVKFSLASGVVSV